MGETVVADVAPGIASLSRRARALVRLFEQAGARCELVLPSGQMIRCGEGPPAFRLTCRSEAALAWLDELSLGHAYVKGHIDLDGDVLAMLDVRSRLRDGATLLQQLRFYTQLFLRPVTWVNRKAISYHYTLGDDFYLSFIDRRYRFYSHCVFKSDADTLEDAAEHKLETMWEALQLRPGMRLLDIGGGWGGVTEYCGARGVHVTSLTLTEDSRRYIEGLIRKRDLPGEVLFGDFLEHRPERPYDAAVIYGVIEHLPNYRHFCARVWDCLPEGGRIYVDASATKWKYDMSAFTRHYTWRGTHTFLSLQNILEEFLFHGFKIKSVVNETRDYEQTIHEWARRLDAQRDAIVAHWGEEIWRAFRVYLWGGCHAFRTDELQAYHLVAERGAGRGPRPDIGRRAFYFLRSLP